MDFKDFVMVYDYLYKKLQGGASSKQAESVKATRESVLEHINFINN